MPKSITSKQPNHSKPQKNANGGRTTNRPPSKITPSDKKLKVLSSNIDTLVVSLNILWEETLFFFAKLTEAKKIARLGNKDCPVSFIIEDQTEEYLFNVKPFGSNGSEWIISNNDFNLTILNSKIPKAMPSATITIRSEILWRIGPQTAVQFIIDFIKQNGGQILKTSVSRVDLCLDTLFPKSLWTDDILDYAVTRATYDNSIADNDLVQKKRNHKKLSTIDIGVDCRALIPTKCHAIVPMSDRGRPGSFYHQA